MTSARILFPAAADGCTGESVYALFKKKFVECIKFCRETKRTFRSLGKKLESFGVGIFFTRNEGTVHICIDGSYRIKLRPGTFLDR